MTTPPAPSGSEAMIGVDRAFGMDFVAAFDVVRGMVLDFDDVEPGDFEKFTIDFNHRDRRTVYEAFGYRTHICRRGRLWRKRARRA